MSDLREKAKGLDLDSLLEIITLLAYNFGEHNVVLGTDGIAMGREIIITLAIEFELEHRSTNWDLQDWEDTAFEFVANYIKEKNIPHRLIQN